MHLAKFNEGINEITVPGLVQWDSGQKLAIELPTIPSKFEIHFAQHKLSKTALVVDAVIENGVIIAPIPNILLQASTGVYAWICRIDESDYKTIKSIYMPVEARPKPSDYVYTETEIKRWEDLAKTLESWEEDATNRVVEAAMTAVNDTFTKEVESVRLANSKTQEQLDNHTEEYDKKVAELEGKDKNLTDALDAEIERADRAEKTNASAISAEVARSTEAEEALDKKIADEVTRQDQDIADATATANAAKTTADTLNSTIQFALSHSTETRDLLNEEIETARKAEGDNKTAIAVEEARAKGEEQKNATAIANEKTRAETAEANITNALNAHEQAYDRKIADIEAFNTQDAQNLATHIVNYNTAVRNLEEADQNLSDALAVFIDEVRTILQVTEEDDAGLARLQQVIDYAQSNKALIDEITTSKVSKTDIVDHLLSLETAKPLSANQGSILKDLIDTFKTTYENKVRELEASDKANADAIVVEKSRAELAEKANTNAIEAEETRADTAEKALGVRIDEVQETAQNALGVASSTLDTASRAKALSEQTQTNLNQEIERATQTHKAFTDALNAHKEAYTKKVAELEQSILDEVSRAEMIEEDLADRIAPLEETNQKILDNLDTVFTNGSKGLAYHIYDDYAVCVGIGNCTDTNLEIASMVMGIPVVAIDGFAFDNQTMGGQLNFTSLTIPEGIESIGRNAFYSCPASTVTIMGRNGYLFIEDFAFADSGTIDTLVIGCREVEVGLSAFEHMTINKILYVGTEDEWADYVYGEQDGNQEFFGYAPITYNYNLNPPSPYGNIYTYE